MSKAHEYSAHAFSESTAESHALAAIDARAFSFCYPGASSGLGPLHWDVAAGSFQLMVGANGSGKTTLLRSVVPALAPHGERSGELTVAGLSFDQISASEHFEVAYVATKNQIVCDTVFHELAFGLENLGVAEDDMRRRIADMGHFFGLESLFRAPTATLSDGQRQLVVLAATLLMQPKILLLDEPTAQLDPLTEKNFLHALFRINKELGISLVVATHSPEVMAAYATDAVRLQAGRIKAIDLAEFKYEGLGPSAVTWGKPHPKTGTQCHIARHKMVRDVSDQEIQQDAPCSNNLSHSVGAKRVFRSLASGKLLLGGGGIPRAHKGKKPAPVKLKDVFVSYPHRDAWVLRGCSFEALSGSINALVGGNGCGKSTLLRVVASLLKPQLGRVINELSRCQALLPSDPQALFVCDSVREELEEWQVSCGYTAAEVDDVVSAWGLTPVESLHPFDLSSGQQQMLACAKLLLTHPRLLLLDEPSKGLDAQAKVFLGRQLRQMAQTGVTLIMATHDLSFAALVAHRISMLFDGGVVATQDAATFFTDNLFYLPHEDEFSFRWRKEHVTGNASLPLSCEITESPFPAVSGRRKGPVKPT